MPPSVLQALQVIAAMAVSATMWLAMRARTHHPRLLLALLATAVPWFALAVVRWPTGLAAAATATACLCLGMATSARPVWHGLAAGLALAAAAQLRSEALAVAVVLATAACLGRWRGGPQWRAGPAVAALALALVAMVPWARHYHAQTGRWSLTSSNGAAVAWMSLGQLPANPWGIRHHNLHASAWVRRRGVRACESIDSRLSGKRASDSRWGKLLEFTSSSFGPQRKKQRTQRLESEDSQPLTAHTFSDPARQEFEAAWLEAIQAHPGAAARKVAHNLRNVVLGGLFVGDVPLNARQTLAVDVTRERLKLAVGLNPNETEIAGYRRSGAWDSVGLDGRATWLLAWQAAGVLLGAAWLVAMAAGVWLLRRQVRTDPVLGMLLAHAVAVVALAAVFQYQPRHVTVLSVLGAPFVAEALGTAWRGLQVRRRRA